jgi:acyl-CoA reductase-like NAD-dependent aldehyde dehydrogenase
LHLAIYFLLQLFTRGKFVAPRSGKYFDSINPATEEKLAEIAEADRLDPTSPFGGYKESGYGHESGLRSLLAYPRIGLLCENIRCRQIRWQVG